MDPDNDRSAANERRFGGREGRQDRRATAQERERIVATREDQVAAREALVHAREHAASLRDAMNRQREAAVAHRENMAANLELHLRQADGVQQALEIHMARLRQANEHLVISALQAQTMAEEVQLAKDQMVHMVHHDFLTGLPNRVLLQDRLSQAIAYANRSGHPMWVLLIDLDRFKFVNDSLGHKAGDLLLKTVAERLQAAVRGSDTVARFGGDEFVVLLEEVGQGGEAAAQHARDVADKILRAFDTPFDIDGVQRGRRRCGARRRLGVVRLGQHMLEMAAAQAQLGAAVYAHAVVHAQVEQARGGGAVMVEQRGYGKAEQGIEGVRLQRGIAQSQLKQAAAVGRQEASAGRKGGDTLH
eukprot:gene20750-biopygen16926